MSATGCGASGSIADQSGFEDADGNLAVGTAGCKDWNSFSPTWTGSAPFQSGTASSGGLTFVGATDAANSTSDSIYAGGVKQDTVCPATVTGKANDKADLARMYIATETVNGKVYLFLAWERQLDTTVNSDVFVSFEFNQGSVSCGSTSPFVKRTKGDLLFDYNFQSGNSTITAEQWDGSTWQTLPTPPFQAAVNSGTVTDTLGPSGSASLTQFEFGEAGINLSDLDLTGNGGKACETFGSVLGGSRTSKSGDTAQLKDFVGPVPVAVSNCATPTIVTTQEPAIGSTSDTFKDKATISGLATPNGDGTLTFNLYSQKDCKGSPLDTETITGIGADGDYEAPNGVELDTAGTYYWVASFSGDDFNNSSSSGCNDEPVIVNSPDLSMTKKADHSTVSAGDSLGFTLIVGNGGPGTAKDVTLADPLPAGTTSAGWTLDSNSGSATCSINGAVGSQELDCDAIDLASGDSYELHISAATSFAACTKYDNTATASASNAPDAQGSDSIQCRKPSLSVTKTADHSSVDAGDPLGFTITVSNSGPGSAKDVTLADPLPAGTPAAGWTLDSNSGSANCTINGSVASQELDCDAIDLASGDSYQLHISAATSFAACTKYDNTATASASNAPDAQGSDSIQCRKPSLSVTKTADHSSVDAGDPLGFTITVSNGGPGTAKDVTLADPLPAGTTAAGWRLDSNSGSANCVINGSVGSQELDCDAIDLASGDSYTLHISAATSNADCTKYDNTATASASNAPDAQGSDSIQCRKPGLNVFKTADHSTVDAGDPLGFTITVSNGGPGTAKDVTLADPLPTGTTAAGWTLDSNSGSANCAVNGSAGSQELDCSAVDLAAKGSYTVHVSADTSFAACTVYDNTATASASNAPDAQGSDSIQCREPSLSVTKTADHSSVDAGDPLGFTITVSNGGPGTAKDVTLADPLPAGTTAAGWTLDSNSGSANCTINGSLGSQELDCSAVDLAAGDSYGVHVSAATSLLACVLYDNTATASASNAPDASGSAVIRCSPARVSIAKRADHSGPVSAGDRIGFTVEVKNTGSGAATGVSLSDPLPAGSGSGVTWAVDSNVGTPSRFVLAGAAGSQTLSLASGVLPAGADYTVHITAATSQSECGSYDNTATLTTGNAGNPSPVSAEESCLFQVDLAISKSGSPARQEGLGEITWTMLVKNNGPDTDTGVTISDPIPAGNSFVSATSSQGSCSGGVILHCTIGSMTAGQTVTITLITRPSAPGTVTNTAVVQGDRPETTLANNTASASVVIVAPHIIFCVAVGRITPGELIVGRKTTLTIHLTQHGKPAPGIRVRIKGPKLNTTSKPSNSKGIIKQTVKMRKKGILTITPLTKNAPRCGNKRIGVRGIFTPPVTG